MPQAALESAQFCEAAQPANGGVARIETGFAQIIEHAMAVIGSHGDALRCTLRRAPGEFSDDRFQHRSHVDAAVEMFGLMKTAVGFARDIPKVEKMDARAKPPDHRGQVVVWMSAE